MLTVVLRFSGLTLGGTVVGDPVKVCPDNLALHGELLNYHFDRKSSKLLSRMASTCSILRRRMREGSRRRRCAFPTPYRDDLNHEH